jgi:acyl-homoserine lactone acylase PvdQ
VDGSDPATEWQGLLPVDESPNLLNPKSGWLYNVNNWPWSAAGAVSPRREDYPAYVENGRSESARGWHAIRVLQGRTDFTLDSLVAAAYDSYLPAFEQALPALVAAYDALADGDARKAALVESIALVRGWDYRWSADSVATTLAITWAEQLNQQLDSASGEQRLAALEAATRKLAADHGTWKTPWGSVNRFQRLDGAIAPSFDDAAPSLPVGFPSARWGSLASFGARAYKNTKKLYGSSGNSFVAVVEFGERVRARAVSAGGQATRPHGTSTTRRIATAPAIYGPSTSIARTSRAISSASTARAVRPATAGSGRARRPGRAGPAAAGPAPAPRRSRRCARSAAPGSLRCSSSRPRGTRSR